MSSALHRLSGRYSDGHTAAVREVVLRWGAGAELHLFWGGAEEEVEIDRWPLAMLKIDDFSDGLILVRWERPGTSIHPVVEVPKSIAAPLLEAIEQAERLAAQATPSPWDDLRAYTPRRWRGAVVAALFLAVVVGGAWLSYRAVTRVSVLVPREWERRIFRDVSKVVERGSCRGVRVESIVRDWLRTLPAEVSGQFAYVLVNRACGMNAFVLPGDHLMVCRDMLKHGAEHPEELIGVMAHEAAHLSRRHLIRNIARNQMVELLAGFIGGVTGTSFFLGESIAAIGGLKFGRDEEIEADQLGVRWLHLSGWGGDSLVNALSRLRAHGATQRSRALLSAPEIFSTHPDMDQRIDALRDYVKGLAEELGPQPERPTITEHDRQQLLWAYQEDCGR